MSRSPAIWDHGTSGAAAAHFDGQPLHGLADDLKLPDDRALINVLGEEALPTDGGVFGDPHERIVHLLQSHPRLFHNGTASRRTRSRTWRLTARSLTTSTGVQIGTGLLSRLSRAGLRGQAITPTSAELSISSTRNVEIDASALTAGIAVSGNNARRVFNNSGGVVSLHRLTLRNGSATTVGRGVFLAGGVADFHRCTLSGNTASATGGIMILDGTLALRHTTVTQNAGNGFSGGMLAQSPASVSVERSLIAANRDPGSNRTDLFFVSGTLTPIGPSLIGSNETVATPFPTGALAGTALAPLDGYTGPTFTAPPIPGSPAIDAARSGRNDSRAASGAHSDWSMFRGFRSCLAPAPVSNFRGPFGTDSLAPQSITPLAWAAPCSGFSFPDSLFRFRAPMRLALKSFFLLLLAAAIFLGAWYYTDKLFVAPERALKEEKLAPPLPPPPDESLPELAKALASKQAEKWLEARTALETFVEQWPDSTKIEEARDALGEVNARILFTPVPAPEKQLYVVRSGDVLTRVAARTKSTPELIMRANNLSTINLRIDQKLSVPATDFSVHISRKRNLVTLSNGARYFRQYAIRSWPAQAPGKRGSTGLPAKLTGKVVGKLSWADGQLVNFTEKGYATASHWIQLSLGSYTLHADSPDPKAHKPPSGVALAPEALPDLAAVLRKGDPVTIE
jgi:LysM repeat protein